MKTDLDAHMHANNLDALLITGSGKHNPEIFYFTGGGHISEADLLKVRGKPPFLFYGSPMERDEAAKTGLANKRTTEYDIKALMKAANGDKLKAVALRYQKMFQELGITHGRVGISGLVKFGATFQVFNLLRDLLPEIEFVDGSPTLLEARATKDEAEIARIRRMGQITTFVVNRTAEFLTSHKAKNDVLVKKDGQPLTIGEVKRQINLWLAEQEAENPEGTIFAIGRDAGVPHSGGNPTDLLQLGKTIVFDIFPCEAGGGYFYDFTRTWCLGYATDESLKVYEDVLHVYRQIMSELKAGEACFAYQKRTCELFESQGHPTILTTPNTTSGYVHGLGHGLGLNVHEAPWFREGGNDKLTPGVVITVEPGLYYPERGLGCRLEDTVWVRPDGAMEVLAEYPLDLVLPVK